MKISIVVLTYNSADFVTETLESVWRQSFNGDLELIVADDCSTDSTVGICREWISSHKERFCSAEVLTSEENAGVTANVDRACRKATGEWLKVIAGDDILMDDCLDKLLSGAEKFGPDCQFISAQALVFSDPGSLNRPDTLEIMDPIPDKEYIDIRHLLRNSGFWVPAPTFMYKKDLLESIGYFPQILRNVEDAPFLAQILVKGFRVYIIHTPAVYYRSHEKSLSNTTLDNSFGALLRWTIYKKIVRHSMPILLKWDAFIAYFPFKIRIKKKGRISKTEKQFRKYGKYLQVSYYCK